MEKHAIILGPVQAVWDKGAFAAPLSERLTSMGYIVTIIDCMRCERATSPGQIINDIEKAISEANPTPALIAGHAFGGLAAVHMAKRFQSAAILGLSAPVKADAPLRRKLMILCDLLDKGQSVAAMTFLHYFVGAPDASREVDFQTAHKMSRMFKQLTNLSAQPLASLSERKMLLLYGMQSNLVTGDHVPEALKPYARKVVGAGMRLLNDAPMATVELVTDWIKER